MSKVIEFPGTEVLPNLEEALVSYLSDNKLDIKDISCAHIIVFSKDGAMGSLHLGDTDPLTFIGALEILKADILEQMSA